MATLTSNSSIASTGLKYRGTMLDRPYTGSIAIRSIAEDCDGSLILYYEDGKLIGQFFSTTRTLALISDSTKLVYSSDKTKILEDKSPIEIKPGKYYVRFYPGSSAYYTHAAVRSSCGCGWCPAPCDKIWSVVSGATIQSLHEGEKSIPGYDEWIPIAYHLGMYGVSYADAKAAGKITPTADISKNFSSVPVKNLKQIQEATSGSTSGGSGTTITNTPVSTNVSSDGYSLFNVSKDSDPFLNFTAVDFCSLDQCDLPEADPAAQAPVCKKCGGVTEPDPRPNTTKKRCNCNCK